MGITVLTTVWGSYGQFLGDWAQSVIDQRAGCEVVIAELGDCEVEAKAAAAMLRRAGIPVQIARDTYRGMGHARNYAVDCANTEWVMHLDADDWLLPGALDRVGRLTDKADVVSLGARYPSGKERCFPWVSAKDILKGRLGCFSCSPFRRSFWEQAPYQTRNDYVDSMLWVGFAKLGARFAGTDKPGFVYRQHSGSFSKSLTRRQRSIAVNQLRRALR